MEAAMRGRPRQFDVDAVLDRAIVVFWRHGYDGASLAELTAAMEISPPSLYAAFGGKRELFARAFERYLAVEMAYVDHALTREKLADVFHDYLFGTAGAVTRGDRPHGCMSVQIGGHAPAIRRTEMRSGNLFPAPVTTACGGSPREFRRASILRVTPPEMPEQKKSLNTSPASVAVCRFGPLTARAGRNFDLSPSWPCGPCSRPQLLGHRGLQAGTAGNKGRAPPLIVVNTTERRAAHEWTFNDLWRDMLHGRACNARSRPSGPWSSAGRT